MHPLVLDRSFLWALALKYGLYAAWGISAFITGSVAIRDLSGGVIELVWTSLLALISAGLTALLIREAGGWDHGGSERGEAVLTWAWVSVVSLYPVALLYRLITGDMTSPNQLFIALGFLVVPTWRLIFLLRKNRQRGPR